MKTIQCFSPSSLQEHGVIELAHNSGRKQQQLLSEYIYPGLGIGRDLCHDAVAMRFSGPGLLVSTDSFVVKPRWFPGGDIGKLAVFGSCNDIAMAGGEPLYLTVALILEEGLAIDELNAILLSMRSAADECGVRIIGGDTKVVEKGCGDGLFINTTAIGRHLPALSDVHPRSIVAGDQVLLSGDLGRHGLSILAHRHGFDFAGDEPLASDCGSLVRVVKALADAKLKVHCMRDMTRGGLVASATELADASSLSCCLNENSLRVCDSVSSLSDLLGVDPLYAANEGRFFLVVAQQDVEPALAILREFKISRGAYHAGEFCQQDHVGFGSVLLRQKFGGERFLMLLNYDQLPRIC